MLTIFERNTQKRTRTPNALRCIAMATTLVKHYYSEECNKVIAALEECQNNTPTYKRFFGGNCNTLFQQMVDCTRTERKQLKEEKLKNIHEKAQERLTEQKLKPKPEPKPEREFNAQPRSEQDILREQIRKEEEKFQQYQQQQSKA